MADRKDPIALLETAYDNMLESRNSGGDQKERLIIDAEEKVLKAIDLLRTQEPRVMTLDLPPEEWQDKVIWLEIKGKKPIPCLFRKCCDRMMFGRYERIMSFDAIGSSKEGGYFLRNYGVNWRCWTSRPTDEQREATSWANT